MFRMLFYIGMVFTIFFGGVSAVLYKRNGVAELLRNVLCVQKKMKHGRSDEEQRFLVVEEDIVMVHTKERIGDV